MLLRRVGNKRKVAQEIIKFFPEHSIYIELFFGAGGLYFVKPKAKYNYLNDIDNDVYNLFNVLIDNPKELQRMIELTPIHSTQFQYYKDNQEIEPVKKAMRFLYLSNYSYLGTSDMLRYGHVTSKLNLEISAKKTIEFLKNEQFLNYDFRNVLSRIPYVQDGRNDEDKTFIYADPPYLSTGNNYANNWTLKDTQDLFELLRNSGMKFAMSEFKNPEILKLTEGLNVYEIAERQTLKSRNTEILITNFKRDYELFGDIK